MTDRVDAVDDGSIEADPIVIRPMAPTDAAAYRALSLAGYRRHRDAFTATVAERESLPLSWWASRVEREFVASAWVEDRLVGVAGLAPETRPKTRHKGTLFGMHVDASFARRGIGGRLVHAVLDRARDDGLRVVQLTVSEGNDAARALYERCGFAAFGIEPFGIRDDGPDGPRFIRKVHMWIDVERWAAERDGSPQRSA